MNILGSALATPPPPTDTETDPAVTGFLNHLVAIQQAQKPKKWSERYLIDGVFGRSNNDAELQAYCRVNLKVAIDELTALNKQLRDPQSTALTFAALVPCKATIRDHNVTPADD